MYIVLHGGTQAFISALWEILWTVSAERQVPVLVVCQLFYSGHRALFTTMHTCLCLISYIRPYLVLQATAQSLELQSAQLDSLGRDPLKISASLLSMLTNKNWLKYWENSLIGSLSYATFEDY